MKLISKVIEGLPLHYQKDNNIKFFLCFETIIEYLNALIEELKGQTSLYKANGIFLDFLGEHYRVKRNNRNDDEYRKALMSKRMATSGLPTTEFLLDIARQLSGAEIVDFKTRYNGEVASQYFRADIVDSLDKINLFPDLNKVCEAGARMYWDLNISDENLIYNYKNYLGLRKKIEMDTNFEIDQTVRIYDNINFFSIIGIVRKLELDRR